MSNESKPTGDTKPQQQQPRPTPVSVPQQKDVPMPRPPIDGTHGIKPGNPLDTIVKKR